MQTLLIYNFILLWATFFGFLYERSEIKGIERLYIFLSFLIPFLFSALRYDIGTDYQNYVAYFHRIGSGELILKEPAYLLINKFLYEANLDVQWLFVVFGFLFMLFSYKAIPKRGFAIAVFIFISTLYLYEGFSMLRQGLATVIMAYGIKYIVDRKFLIYLLLSLFAMTFHFATGLIFLIAYPIVIFKYNRFMMIGFLCLMFLIVFKSNALISMMHFFVSFFPKYAWYIDSKYMEIATISSGLGIIFRLILGILIIFFKDKIAEKIHSGNVVINLYYLYLFFTVCHLQFKILGRVEHMFIFSQVLAITYFILVLQKQIRVLFILLIILMFFIVFNKYILKGTLDIDNDIYINPYQSILNR